MFITPKRNGWCKNHILVGVEEQHQVVGRWLLLYRFENGRKITVFPLVRIVVPHQNDTLDGTKTSQYTTFSSSPSGFFPNKKKKNLSKCTMAKDRARIVVRKQHTGERIKRNKTKKKQNFYIFCLKKNLRFSAEK